MKRTIAALLLFTLLACALGGCGGKQAYDFKLDTSKPVTLNIVGSLDNFEGLEAVIAKFEAQYQNCTVTYTRLNDYSSNIITRLTNQSADTHMFASSRSDFTDTSAERAVIRQCALDMSDEKATGIDLSTTNPAVTQSQTVGGKLYTVPLAMAPRGIVVNKTLLKKHGLSVPANYAQFLAACETLKNAGYLPLQAQASALGQLLMYSYFANSIVHHADYEKIFSEMNAFTPGSGKYLTDTFTRLDTLVSKGYIDYRSTADWKNNYDVAIMDFFEGDMPFLVCTAETVSGMRKRESKSAAYSASPFEYEFIAVPMGDDGAYCYWQVWQGLSINKNADNQNWARAFMNFLAKGENMKLLADTKGMPSNTKEMGSDVRYASLYTLDDAHVTEAAKFQISFYRILLNVLERISRNPDDPEHLDARSAEKYYEELIAQARAQ